MKSLLKAAVLAQVSDKVASSKSSLGAVLQWDWLWFLEKPDSDLAWVAFKNCLNSVLFKTFFYPYLI